MNNTLMMLGFLLIAGGFFILLPLAYIRIRDRLRGWRIVEFFPNHLYFQVYDKSSLNKGWYNVTTIHPIKKSPLQNRYYAGCFSGTYDEARSRIVDKPGRHPALRDYYMDKLDEAADQP